VPNCSRRIVAVEAGGFEVEAAVLGDQTEAASDDRNEGVVRVKQSDGVDNAGAGQARDADDDGGWLLCSLVVSKEEDVEAQHQIYCTLDQAAESVCDCWCLVACALVREAATVMDYGHVDAYSMRWSSPFACR
jgi:hypothetical protein